MKRSLWLSRGDITIDCSAYRLPFEWVTRRRGTNAVGKHGMGIARRWLASMGIQLERHHSFAKRGMPSSHPDFFDHSTRMACEVKTGRQPLTNKSLNQILEYERAVKTGQAKLVAHLSVGLEGKVGLAPRFREELLKRRFLLLILR